jgi:archaellum component FlaF (FlaF/FlaG flagellin family)
MEMAVEALRNGDIGLNAASFTYLSSSKMYLKRHSDGKNYFSVENIQVIAEGELVNRFANGAIRVLYNHQLFTKLGF